MRNYNLERNESELTVFSDIFGEYLNIEGALTVLVDGLMDLSEKSEITQYDVSNYHSALTVIRQQIRIINESLDLQIVKTCY